MSIEEKAKKLVFEIVTASNRNELIMAALNEVRTETYLDCANFLRHLAQIRKKENDETTAYYLENVAESFEARRENS